MRLLVTGGAGFIGSNFIRYILQEHPGWEIKNYDKLTYAGNLENLKDVAKNPRYSFFQGDIAAPEQVDAVLKEGCDTVINFAAESHVDRSILSAAPFIETNIKGTQILLEGARRYQIKRFIQVSTDEVYGSLGPEGSFTEDSPILPNSPYSASKAAADLLCRAYYRTFDLPVVVTRCCNNYGPFQFPEKFIPLIITRALENEEIPLYGDGLNTRDWIHVTDHCRALDAVIQQGKTGQIYNIGANNEKTNLELVQLILKIMGKPSSLIKYVTDRPAHDRRYAINSNKIERNLGWKARMPFEAELRNTIRWYEDNKMWWQRIKSGEYADYYRKNYSQR